MMSMLVKKKFKLILFTVIVLFLMACGNEESVPSTPDHIETSTIIESENESLEESEESEEISTSQESEEAEETSMSQEFQSAADLEETVLVDENDIKITVTEIEYTNYAVELKLILENNSDKDLTFTSGTGGYSCNAVNGYMINGGYLYVQIPAGKKAKDTIKFSIEELALYGITEIADIQLGFEVEDDNWNETQIGPKQIYMDTADSYDYVSDTYLKMMSSGIWEKLYKCTIDYFTEEELYNQEDVKIVSAVLLTNKDGHKHMLLEVQNDSDKQIGLIPSNITVNGLTICGSAWSADIINPRTRCLIDLPFYSMLEEPYWEILNMSTISDISFSFALSDTEKEKINQPEEINISISEQTVAIDDSGEELYNEDGIRVIYKGLFEDSASYSENIHMCLLVENVSDVDIYIDGVYDSMSVNGFMTDFHSSGWDIPIRKYAVADIVLQWYSLEDNAIAAIEDIEEIEMKLKIKEGYDVIDEPTILITN